MSTTSRFFVEMDGFEDLMRELNELGPKGERQVNNALRKGADVFLQLAVSKVNYSKRKSNKHLKTALKVSTVKMDDAGEKYVSVGTYLGNGRYRDNVYWGHILEGGHWIVTKTGKVVGYVSARPFMQPAYEQGQDKAAKIMSDIIFNAMGLRK